MQHYLLRVKYNYNESLLPWQHHYRCEQWSYMCCLGVMDYISLVPRLHPLKMRNGLLNRVEFLGLVHAFVTM